MKTYMEVPVSAAKAIAENFDKQEVIILAIDREHRMTHITTFGTDEIYKMNAEVTGDFLTEVLELRKPALYFELIERAKMIWKNRRRK